MSQTSPRWLVTGAEDSTKLPLSMKLGEAHMPQRSHTGPSVSTMKPRAEWWTDSTGFEHWNSRLEPWLCSLLVCGN
jgi:hypothetical protein